MANYTIKAETGHINLSPIQFRIYANQHLECEERFRSSDSAGHSPIPYYLLCRALELELKARHLEHKTRDEVKKRYGHSLVKAYDDLPLDERTLDAPEYEAFVRASEIYDIPEKGFEYVSVFDAVTTFDRFPDLDLLRKLARKLVPGDA